MIILKNAFIAAAIPALLVSLAGTCQADSPCYENCSPAPVNAATYKVETYEDKQNICGYDVEAKPQVCVDTHVVQVDTSKITRTHGEGIMSLNANTATDVQYTSSVSFGDGT